MAPMDRRLAIASDHERDHLAGVVTDDGGTENAPAGRDDGLDHAGRQPLDLGEVVADEREAQHADARAMTATGLGLAETDGGERRIGEGHRGRRGRIVAKRPAKQNRAHHLPLPDSAARAACAGTGDGVADGVDAAIGGTQAAVDDDAGRRRGGCRRRRGRGRPRPACGRRRQAGASRRLPPRRSAGSATVKRMPPRRRPTETISTPARTRMPSARRRSMTIAASSGSSSGSAGPRSRTVASMPSRL